MICRVRDVRVSSEIHAYSNIFQQSKRRFRLQYKQLFLREYRTARLAYFRVQLHELPLILHAPHLQVLVLAIRDENGAEQVAVTHARLVELTKVATYALDANLLDDVTAVFDLVNDAVRSATDVDHVFLNL